MKKITAFVLIATLAAITVVAQNYSVTVTTTSTDLMPKARGITVTTWTNNLAVSAGDYVVNTNTSPPRTYWAVSAGTSTTVPSHGYGLATAGDGIEWLYFNPQRRRKGAIIFADTSATVYYTSDGQSATTSGSVLDAVRPARGFPGDQGQVKAIVSSGTATVNVELDY